jgi:predicted acylesterase/phospholipase RssA
MGKAETKYAAVTIAGAVSLGSYESGAMYELLDALAQHNASPLTKQSGDYVKIDVITGASAGGVTGAILTQRL